MPRVGTSFELALSLLFSLFFWLIPLRHLWAFCLVFFLIIFCSHALHLPISLSLLGRALGARALFSSYPRSFIPCI
jgi:hypothetical protein